MMTSGNLARRATLCTASPTPGTAAAAQSERGLLAPELVRAALKQSFIMLRPDIQWKPRHVRVEVGAF